MSQEQRLAQARQVAREQMKLMKEQVHTLMKAQIRTAQLAEELVAVMEQHERLVNGI